MTKGAIGGELEKVWEEKSKASHKRKKTSRKGRAAGMQGTYRENSTRSKHSEEDLPFWGA